MKKKNTIFSTKHIVSSLVMLAALAWLTVSTPFVYASQQVQKEIAKQQACDNSEESSGTALPNTTEEKPENNSNTLSEYLHDTHFFEHHFTIVTKYYKGHQPTLHLFFTPELLSPPPEV